jgi:putative lipoprotein
MLSCASIRFSHGYDPWFAKDKMYHFVVSGAIGAGATSLAMKYGDFHEGSPLMGISVSATVGAGKEYYDAAVKQTFWSWKDMMWDLAGGTAGSYLYYSYHRDRAR